MKKAFVAIIALSVVVVILFAVLSLLTSPTPKSYAPPGGSAHLAATEPEAIIDLGGTTKEAAISSAAGGAPVPALPPPEKSAEPTIAVEQLTTPPQPEPTTKDPLPPNPATEKSVEHTAFAPTPLPVVDNRVQGLGLLTDTGETDDNQILEPQSTQVQPTVARKAGKKTEGPRSESRVKENKNQEIASNPAGTYPFSILLETLDKQTNAQQAVALYRKRGVECFWVKVDLGNSGVKYRLFTGAFPTEAAARTFLVRHRLTGKLVKNAAYAAQIGSFGDTKDLAMAFDKTKEAGAFPYVLGNTNGHFFLYVGAFYTLDGAESQCRELVEKGLPCKAVPRSTAAN